MNRLADPVIQFRGRLTGHAGHASQFVSSVRPHLDRVIAYDHP